MHPPSENSGSAPAVVWIVVSSIVSICQSCLVDNCNELSAKSISCFLKGVHVVLIRKETVGYARLGCMCTRYVPAPALQTKKATFHNQLAQLQLQVRYFSSQMLALLQILVERK